jgi:HK97 family phage major capsid protein
MSDLNEIKGLVEKINTALVPLRADVDAVKNRDVLDEAKFDKMASQITDAMAKVQAAEAKAAALEAAMSRVGMGDNDTKSELSEKTRAALDSYLRDGIAPSGVKMTAEGLEVRAMSTNVNPDGGYLVRPELASFVVDRIFETSPLRRVARVEQVGSNSLDVLIDDNEAGFRWVSQGISGGETTTPQIGQKAIVPHKMEADPRITTEQIQDSYLDVEAWLAGKVADRFARGENTAFVTGTGVGQPRGFLTYAAWAAAGVYERDKIEQVISGAAAAVTADGFITLQNALKEDYQARAVWGMKRTTFGTALKQKGQDNYFFSPVLLANGQSTLQLLGKTVVFMDDMPAEGAGNLSVVYGDFSRAYTIADRVGLQILRDPFTNKGFVTYYTTKRVGGDVTSFDAIKIGRCAAP